MIAEKKIAYVLKGYPRLSETFIANEVRLLEELGLKLQLFSIKSGDTLAADPNLPGAHYLPKVTSMSQTGLITWLRVNLPAFAGDQWYWLRSDPVRYAKTAAFALHSAVRYRAAARSSLKKTFIKEFLFASHVGRGIREDGGITHVHAHFCHDATTVAWMVSRLTGIPFSFTAHAKDIYQSRLNPGDLLERKLAAASFAVTCTHTNVAFLRQRCGSPEKVHGIYHGLNTRMFLPRNFSGRQTRSQSARLISVGRMVEKKGFIYLIEACRKLRDRGVIFSLDIIGEDGDQSDALRAAIEDGRLQEHVRLLAPVAQRDLVEVYKHATAFVLPCVVLADGDRDGIPNVMAEAMACALPVVVTDVSGIPEIVEHDVNGVIVPPRDSDALTDAIEALIKNPGRGEQIGRAARERIESVFDAASTHRTLKVLFDAVLGGTTRAS